MLKRDQGTILRSLDKTIASDELDFWVTFGVLVALTLLFDIDDPYFLSCRHFSIEQQVFCILEIAALLL